MSMKPRPDLEAHEFIGGGQPDKVVTDLGSDRIVMIPVDKLRPNSGQTRGPDHWQKPETKAHITKLASSMRMILANGQPYGVRRPLEVRPMGEDGLHEIIAGENRWRSAMEAELTEVPARIRAGDAVETRLDHVTENALRSDLTLWQTAQAIVADQESYGLSREQIIIAHGLRDKAHLSKILSVLKLAGQARDLVESGKVDNVEYAYQLKSLTSDQVVKFAKLLDKDTPVSQALKTVTKPKPTKGPAGDKDGQGGSKPAPTVVALTLSIDAAKALALKLEIEPADDVEALQRALAERISELV